MFSPLGKGPLNCHSLPMLTFGMTGGGGFDPLVLLLLALIVEAYVGDARLVFELLLLFLFLGYLVLRASFDDRDKADRVSAILAAVGAINVPIIHYSVEWWSTLHQGPTIARLDSPSITPDMLVPLLIMIVGFTVYFAWVVIVRLQGEVLERQRSARWVQQLAAGGAE